MMLIVFPVPSSSYIPWNLHEPERGKFNFSGNLDLEYVVLLLL
jgi:beta-galactosidase GanA